MEDKKILLEKRIQRFEDVYNLKQPDKVPILSLVDNYAFHHSGYTFKEIINDDEKHYKAYEKIITDFAFDGAVFACNTKPMKFLSTLGGGSFQETDSLQVNPEDILSMGEDEYKDFAKDPLDFLTNVIYPRKYKLFAESDSEEKYKKFETAVDHLFDFVQLRMKNKKMLAEKHGMPVITSSVFIMPSDLILDYFRDFKGTMTDIRRRPKEFLELSDALVPLVIQEVIDFYPEHKKGGVIFVPLHLPQFMSAKMFEKVYLPSFRKVVDGLAEKGFKLLLYFERNWEHLYDYIKELPPKSVIGLFEEDDVSIAKKELGHTMCIAGGMQLNLLKYESKQVCLDAAKKLIDQTAPGGGYIFTTNSIVHSAGDVKEENLKAVNEFVMEYGKY